MPEHAVHEAERILAQARPQRLGWLLTLPYPLRSILHRWRGTIGMVMGVGIALGLGMTLLGSSNALIDIYTEDYRLSSADLYVIQRGGTLIPVLPSDTPGRLENARSKIGRIRAMQEVRSALGVMSWTLEREHEFVKRRDDPTELINAFGVDGDPTLLPGSLLLEQGRWLQRSNEVVLGPRLAREKGLVLGDTLRLNGHDFTVAGIGKLRGFGFNLDGVAYLDIWAFRQRVDVGDVLSIVAVDSADPAATRAKLADLDSVAVFDPDALVQAAEKAMETDMAAHWTLIVLTLSIAGLFVSNMLGGSVVARRLEFATLRAIGLPRRTILLAVAGEAVLICLAAGVVGVLIATGLGALFNEVLARAYGLDKLYAADAELVALIFGLALGLGLLAGYFPARDATRVEPVEVLREA